MNDRIARDASACRACPLGGLGGPRCVGFGPRDATVAVVGINPSRIATDGVYGCFLIPYLAAYQRAGRTPPPRLMRGSTRGMWHLAAESGLDLSRVYSTNAVKCATPGNRKPTPAEVRTCRENHLTEELAGLTNLRLVLFFGAAAGSAAGLSDFGARTTVEETIAEGVLLRHPNSTCRKWTNLGRDARRIREALELAA